MGTDTITADDDRWRLIYAFPDQSEAFAFGFEAGQIDHRMRNTAEVEFEVTVHTANAEMFERMARAWGWSVAFELTRPVMDEWRQATFRRLGVGEAKRRKSGLRVVEAV